MATTLRVESFGDANIKEQQALDANAAAGATTLTLKNTANFGGGTFVYVGNLGTKVCEKLTINTVPSATSITVLAGPGIVHNRFEPITAVFGDQIKIYRALNVDGTIPADISFASAGLFVNLNPVDPYTEITDVTGSNAYWYKAVYYNSSSLAETSLASATAARGEDYGHYADLSEIRSEAGMTKATNLSESVINRYRLDAEAMVNGALVNTYTVPFLPPTPQLVRKITIGLAAGALMQKDYGAVNPDSTKDAKSKVADAMALIAQLQAHTIVLLDYKGTSLVATSAISSWADDSTATADPITAAGGDRIFKIGQTF